MPTSTHAAHDVKPYTNTSGKYVMVLQQKRSTFLAHTRRRMVRDGDEGGEGDPSVAILPRQTGQNGMRRVRRREAV